MGASASPPSASSAARIAPRRRGRLPAPAKAARNRPPGRSARRISASAPGRSLTVSSVADRDDEVERGVGEGKAVLVALHAAGARGEGGAGIGGDDSRPRARSAAAR